MEFRFSPRGNKGIKNSPVELFHTPCYHTHIIFRIKKATKPLRKNINRHMWNYTFSNVHVDWFYSLYPLGINNKSKLFWSWLETQSFLCNIADKLTNQPMNQQANQPANQQSKDQTNQLTNHTNNRPTYPMRSQAALATSSSYLHCNHNFQLLILKKSIMREDLRI